MHVTRDPLLPLIDALNAALRLPIGSERTAGDHVDAAIRSAVRAVLPGRQQQKNLRPLQDAARKAFVRTLRRRARS